MDAHANPPVEPGTPVPPKVVVNAPPPDRPPDEPVTFLAPEQMRWTRIVPEMGEQSPRLTILRQDPRTGSTTLLIWTPPGFHVPRHWHSGSEKHMVVRGTFVLECDGRKMVMKPGAFNYLPARAVHEAWTLPDEDCLLLTDVDRLWDVNWIDPPPDGRASVEASPAEPR